MPLKVHSALSTSKARTNCSAMPQKIARQLTARRFLEHSAAMPKNVITPIPARPRELNGSSKSAGLLKTYAPAVNAIIAKPMTNRHVTGVAAGIYNDLPFDMTFSISKGRCARNMEFGHFRQGRGL